MTTRSAAADDFFEGRTLGEWLAEGLEEVAAAAKTDPKSIPEKFNCHRISLHLAPTA